MFDFLNRLCEAGDGSYRRRTAFKHQFRTAPLSQASSSATNRHSTSLSGYAFLTVPSDCPAWLRIDCPKSQLMCSINEIKSIILYSMRKVTYISSSQLPTSSVWIWAKLLCRGFQLSSNWHSAVCGAGA